MNGIDTILRRLDTDAKAEADAVLKKARQEAADITARYQAQAAQEAAGWPPERKGGGGAGGAPCQRRTDGRAQDNPCRKADGDGAGL